jgi:dipeptidase E
MPLLMTSTGFFYKNALKTFKDTFLEMNEIRKQKVSIITTAAREKENNLFAKNAFNDFLKMGFAIDQVHFFDFDSNPVNTLLDSTVVSIIGGNPFYLLHSLRANNGQKILTDLFEKKVYFIGISAGAIILGPSLDLVSTFTPNMNSSGITDLTTLNFSKEYIFPHYNRSDLFGNNIEEKIATFERDNNQKVIRLNDDEQLFYP